MSTSQAVAYEHDSLMSGVGALRSAHNLWLADGRLPDFRWVVNGQSNYQATLESLPQVFAWKDSRDVLANIGLLDISVCAHRLRSCLDYIQLYVPDFAESMRNCYEALPPSGKARFMMAPETFYRISRLRKEPSTSVICLCRFLNGESAFHGEEAVSQKQYWTALGDFYYAGPNRVKPLAAERDAYWTPDRSFRAPYLAEAIPMDFVSPNILSAMEDKTIPAEYLNFSPEEIAAVCRLLEDTFRGIARASEAAARLIKECVKVIIPLKVSQGGGSTSQPAYPGRVLLRGVDRFSPTRLASALVHEAIHQFLYILEHAGRFVVNDPEAKANIRVTSLWSGRQLELHSYFHACFVWYGLANFWALAKATDAFDKEAVDQELSRSLAGFRGANPVEALGPHAERVRYEARVVASTLQGELHSLLTS